MNISRDEEIDISVTVVVDPGRAGHEATAAHSGFVGYVLEFAVSQAMVKRASAKTRDENVQLAVVVEIGHGNPHAPALARQACGLSDVGELEIRVLMVERDERVTACAIAIDGRAIHHRNIQLAVIIAIEESDSAAHGFDDVVLFGSGDMRGGQPCPEGDIFKLERRGSNRRLTLCFGEGRKAPKRQEEDQKQNNLY